MPKLYLTRLRPDRAPPAHSSVQLGLRSRAVGVSATIRSGRHRGGGPPSRLRERGCRRAPDQAPRGQSARPRSAHPGPSRRDRPALGASGAGVIVAILDRGIDWESNDLRNDDGTTRIAYIFDLSDDSGAADPRNVYRRGTIYTTRQIDSVDCRRFHRRTNRRHQRIQPQDRRDRRSRLPRLRVRHRNRRRWLGVRDGCRRLSAGTTCDN